MAVVRAQINSNTSNGPKQVSVTIPSASAAQSFRNLNDVDVSTLEDGALIQYNASSNISYSLAAARYSNLHGGSS